jgi:hypothetical protein
MTQETPAGYVRVTAGRCSAVVRAGYEADARALLAEGTPYEVAARDLAARPLEGRGTAYAIALPVSGTRVVVRHNRHGGLLAGITRDLFLPPTRAPRELAMSLRLRAAGILTPELVLHAVEQVAVGLLQRTDVVTIAIEDSRDLATYMQAGEDPAARDEAWSAARALVHAMSACGARHADFNVKNILLSGGRGALVAWMLDVDRVHFTTPQRAGLANAARLVRSARKWRDRWHAELDEARDLGELDAAS